MLFLLNVLEKREEVRIKRMNDLGRLVDDLRYVRLSLKRSELSIYLFLRKEADLAMRDFRNIAVSSDALLIREGKRELGKVRYQHTTETLAVSRLTIINVRGKFTDENI